jgi:hypothetical protein
VGSWLHVHQFGGIFFERCAWSGGLGRLLGSTVSHYPIAGIAVVRPRIGATALIQVTGTTPIGTGVAFEYESLTHVRVDFCAPGS